MRISNGPWRFGVAASLALMAPFDLLVSLAMDIYLPVVPTMPRALNASAAVIQLTLSLYLLALGVGQLAFGPLSDRVGRRPVVVLGGIGFTLTSLALAFADSGAVFLVLRVLQGVCASAVLVATFATVRDVFADRPEGTVIYGLFSSMLAFVPALGPILGASIAITVGWRAIFVLLAAAGAMATLRAYLHWPETRVRAPAPAVSSWHILRDPAFLTYTLGFATALGTFFVFFSTAPRIVVERAGFSQLSFSLLFASVALVMIAAGRLAQPFILRWGTPGTLLRALSLMVFAGAMLPIVDVIGVTLPWSLFAPMWVMAVGIVLAASVTAIGALSDFSQVAGKATALYYCLQSLIVGIVGTAAVLLLPGDGIMPIVFFSEAMALATIGGLIFLRRRGRLPPRRA